MKKLNYCKTCKYRSVSSMCISEKVYASFYEDKDEDDSLAYYGDPDGYFWVGDKFGCVHHAEKEKENAKQTN